MSLKKAATSGVKWSFAAQTGRQIVQLVTMAVLARLLAPSDFGILSMALVVTGFLDLFRDLGTSAVVIRLKNASEHMVSSIFWINLSMGILSTAAVLFCSPLVAKFYGEARITPVLDVLSIGFVLSSLGIVMRSLMERDLAFSALAKIEIFSAGLSSLVGIGLALMGEGIWSLVFQSLSGIVFSTVFLGVSTRWRPRMTFRWNEVKAVSSFSLNLIGFNAFNYFARNADYLLIGRYLGAQDLGYYTLAYRLMFYPLQNISNVFGRVMFPVFSHLQDDNRRLCTAFLTMARSIALISFPMMLGLLGTCDLFVLAFFGPQWAPVMGVLRILAPLGMIQSIVTTVGLIFQAKGRTDLLFRWGVVAGLLVVMSFAFGLRWGIQGVAMAYAIVSAVLAIPNLLIPFSLIGLRLRDLGSVLWRPFLCGLIMLVLITAARPFIVTHLPSQIRLGLLVLLGVLIYGLSGWFLQRQQLKEVYNLARARS